MTDTGKMDALKLRFQHRARTDRAALADAFAVKDRAALLQLAHGLSGVAGIFGYAEIGSRAALVEQAIDDNAPHHVLADLVADLLRALGQTLPD